MLNVRVEISGTYDEMVAELGEQLSCGKIVNFCNKQYMLTGTYGAYCTNTQLLVTMESVNLVKSTEEILAETAVEKAKESLKAAEETLNKIKEKK